MIQFFRKIRKELLTENKISKYLFYAIGEIVLVVIGILIALQINNWNNNRIKKNAENQYYQNIKRQITEDKQEIIGNINYNNVDLNKLKYGVQIIEENDRSKTDSLGYIAMNLVRYSDFNRQSNIYETMVNSGEIKLLKNPDIIDGLRSLEEIYIYINKMENIHRDVILNDAINSVMKNIKFNVREVQRPDNLFTFEFQNLIFLIIRIMNEKDEIYNRALDEIQSIIDLIDEELNIQGDL